MWLVLSLVLLSLLSCVSVGERNQVLSHRADNSQPPVKTSSIFSGELASCQQLMPVQTVTDNTRSINPENISFLNWNIYKGNGHNWQQDLSAFAKTHHVMAIQEAMLIDELTVLLEKHEFNWVMNTAFYLDGAAAGVMNVSSSDAVIDGYDKKLLVANIHGINFTLGTASYREQLQALYQAAIHHDGPMIVAGDFNSWSENRMAEVDALVELLSLSRLEYPVNNKTHLFGNAIDHVFFRGLELVDHQVHQVTSSDHNPISVNFRYRQI